MVERQMTSSFNTILRCDDKPLSKDQLIRAVNSADVLVPTVADNIDRDVIDAAGSRLQLLANFGVGVNHIDLAAAESKGIQVSNTPDVLTEDTADLTMALIAITCRRLGEGERMIRANSWTGWTPTQLMGLRISGKRLGIIGMGRIGEAVARRARGFGMSIHYYNRRRRPHYLENEIAAQYCESLDKMLSEVDIVTINTPYTESTANILNARRLNLIQPHGILINTARGGLVDEVALIECLKNKRIAGAGLDVYDGEPHVNPEFVKLENVVLLPHLGSATVEGRIAMGERVIVNIKDFLSGREVPDRVFYKSR